MLRAEPTASPVHLSAGPPLSDSRPLTGQEPAGGRQWAAVWNELHKMIPNLPAEVNGRLWEMRRQRAEMFMDLFLTPQCF